MLFDGPWLEYTRFFELPQAKDLNAAFWGTDLRLDPIARQGASTGLAVTCYVAVALKANWKFVDIHS